MLPVPSRRHRRDMDDDVSARQHGDVHDRTSTPDDGAEGTGTIRGSAGGAGRRNDDGGWLHIPESRRRAMDASDRHVQREAVHEKDPGSVVRIPEEPHVEPVDEEWGSADDSTDPVLELPHDDSFDFGSDAIELVDDAEEDEPEEPPIRFDPADASLPVDTIPEDDEAVEGPADDDEGTDPEEYDDGADSDEYEDKDEEDGYEDVGINEDGGLDAADGEPNEPMSAQGMSSRPSSNEKPGTEPVSESGTDGEKPDLLSRIKGMLPDMSDIGSKLRSEIGSKEDTPEESGLTEDADVKDAGTPAGHDEPTGTGKDDRRGGGRARRGLHGNPFGRLMGAYRKVSRIRRRIYVITGILACLVGVWTVPNLHTALNPSSSSFESNEGTVKVSDPSYGDGHVSFKATNDSDMIAHISVKAEVKAWSPVPRWPTSLFAPRTIMGCGEMSAEINPGESRTITMECHGGNGIWKRPAIEVISG